jgi:hypothetical protein
MNMQKQTTEQKSVNESQEVVKQKSQSPASVSASAATLSSSAPIGTSKKNLYERVSLWTIACATLLLPIFFLPVFNINFFYAKFGLATVAVLVAAITLTLQVLNDRQVERYSILNFGFVFILPVVYIISSLFSNPRGASLMGNGADLDTAYFFFLGSVLVYVASRVFRAKHTVFLLTLGMVSVSSIISLFHILRFVFGPDFLSFGLFTTISSNTIGGFNELSIYAGLSVILSILALELASIQKSIRIALYVSLTLSLVLMGVTNFNLQNNVFGLGVAVSLSAVIALFSLVLFIHKKVASVHSKLPAVSLSVLLISLVFTIAIVPISNFVLPKVGITQNDVLDVRVAPLAGLNVALETYKSGIKEALLGVGPNKFFIAWGKHKSIAPQDSVNMTPFWNVDFNASSGVVSTTFVTAGILGLLAWVFFFALLVYYIVRLLKKVAEPEKDPAAVFVAWVVSAGTVYLWLVSILFTSGPTILFLAFIFTGLLLATLVREEIVSTKIVQWDIRTYWRGFLTTFAMVVLIALFMYVGYIWQQRVYAAIQIQQAARTLQVDSTKVTEAEVFALKAINTYFNTSDLRLASEIALIRPVKLISENQGIVPAEKLTQEIVNDISFSINAARRAAIDRGASPDYRDWLQLGKAYEAATFLGATSTATLAVESYAEAERLNPTSPVPPYLIGRLYSFARGFEVAEAKLKRAVELKSDYVEAAELLRSINEMNKGQKNPTIVIPEDSASSTKATEKANTNTQAPKR